MRKPRTYECTVCGESVTREVRSYAYTESGLSNIVLQNVGIADCPKCGNSDVIIPRIEKIQRAIAQALANSPARLTGEQMRFLRKHLGLSGDRLGDYLHTDKSKISKWERGEDPIGPATDRLMRLLVGALDGQLRSGVHGITEHLAKILDRPGQDYELYVDAETLQTAFVLVSKAA